MKEYIKDKTEREVIIKELKKIIEKGKRKIYQYVTQVSSSGMSRHIKSFVIIKNEPVSIDWYIARVLSYISRDDKGIKIVGCGMDMGFSLVYDLGRVIYPNGDKKTITGRNGDTEPETDGGYLFKHNWI